MGRLRHLSEQLGNAMDEMRGVIGDRGIEQPKNTIELQPNTEYFLGASSSPTHIIVTKVGKDRIEYVQGPDYKRPVQMERWIAQDLISRGVENWSKRYGGASYPWAKKLERNFEALRKGRKADTVKVADFYPVQVTVEPVGMTRDEAWSEAERYGNVGGSGDTLLIDMRSGGVDELKKDKRFKVSKVEDR
ncbi:MAG: hypothetical protein WC683_01935 [bacterium]